VAEFVIDPERIKKTHPILYWNFKQARGHMMRIEEEIALMSPEDREAYEMNVARLSEVAVMGPDLADGYRQAHGHLLSIQEHLLQDGEKLAPHMWCRYKHADLAEVGHIQPLIAKAREVDPDLADRLADYQRYYVEVMEKPDLTIPEVNDLREEWNRVWGFDPDVCLWNYRDLADVGHIQESMIYAGGFDHDFNEDIRQFRLEYQEILTDPNVTPSQVRNLRNRWRQIWHDQSLAEYNDLAGACEICSKDAVKLDHMKSRLEAIMEEGSSTSDLQAESPVGVEEEVMSELEVAEGDVGVETEASTPESEVSPGPPSLLPAWVPSPPPSPEELLYRVHRSFVERLAPKTDVEAQ